MQAPPPAPHAEPLFADLALDPMLFFDPIMTMPMPMLELLGGEPSGLETCGASPATSSASALSALSSGSPGQVVPDPAGPLLHDGVERTAMEAAPAFAAVETHATAASKAPRKRKASSPAPSAPAASSTTAVPSATATAAAQAQPSTLSTAALAPTPAPAAAPAMSKRARANEMRRRREAHNTAERQRRDELKEGFTTLRQVLPARLYPERKNQVELLQAANTHIFELERDRERLQRENGELLARLDGMRAQLQAALASATLAC